MNVNEKEKKTIEVLPISSVAEQEQFKRYIIPYNDSFEYVFISDILRNINKTDSKTCIIKPVHTIKKLTTIKKRSISKTSLSDYEYAIHFMCSQKIKHVIEKRIKSHLFRVLEYTQKLEDITCDNECFESFF